METSGAGSQPVGTREGAPEGTEQQSKDQLAEELARMRVKCAFYKLVIERYAEAVEAGEQKSVAGLKGLLNPSDPAVQAARRLLLDDYVRELSRGIEGAGEAFTYGYEKHFPIAASKAFDLVRSLRQVEADLDVSFWLTLKETWELKAGDPFDKAVFLCSLLLALGSQNARIRVLELEEAMKHPVVLAEFNGKKWLLDPCQKQGALEGPLEQTLQAFRYQGKRVLRSLYEFNSQDYMDFQEPAEGGSGTQP